jgi:hypothetical protein
MEQLGRALFIGGLAFALSIGSCFSPLGRSTRTPANRLLAGVSKPAAIIATARLTVGALLWTAAKLSG